MPGGPFDALHESTALADAHEFADQKLAHC
jgi:hypothetical protein